MDCGGTFCDLAFALKGRDGRRVALPQHETLGRSPNECQKALYNLDRHADSGVRQFDLTDVCAGPNGPGVRSHRSLSARPILRIGWTIYTEAVSVRSSKENAMKPKITGEERELLGGFDKIREDSRNRREAWNDRLILGIAGASIVLGVGVFVEQVFYWLELGEWVQKPVDTFLPWMSPDQPWIVDINWPGVQKAVFWISQLPFSLTLIVTGILLFLMHYKLKG